MQWERVTRFIASTRDVLYEFSEVIDTVSTGRVIKVGKGLPAVKNGVLITLVRPPDVKHVAFDGPNPNWCTCEGIPIVTEGLAGGSTVGGLGFSVTNPDDGLSTATVINGIQVVLLGAIVEDFDGFHGPVLTQHCNNTNKIIG